MDKAPQILIDVVRPMIRQVDREERVSAAKVAIKTYVSTLQTLELFGDFDLETNEELAAEAAFAEVLFQFS